MDFSIEIAEFKNLSLKFVDILPPLFYTLNMFFRH